MPGGLINLLCMENPQEFNFQNLYNGLAKINQKMIGNYFDHFSSYNHDIRDISHGYFHFLTKLFVSPSQVIKTQAHFFNFFLAQQEIWKQSINRLNNAEYKSIIESDENDKRFKAPQWRNYPIFNFIMQNYLLSEKLRDKLINEVEISEDDRKKLNFYSKQYSNLFSPANFLFTNPEAMELALKTNGKSLWEGFNNFLEDLEKGRISQTDDSAFEVGKNLAITKGSVVFQNKLIELIQYYPSTKKVYSIPLLIFPPWINKYYIFDLQPEDSFVKYFVDQGFSVFIVSWRDPMPGMGYLTFDNYAEAAMQAIEVVREITGVEKINTLGYCLGGTLLSVVASILTTQKREVINTTTFLASMIDFTDIGPMGDVIDKALVKKFERGELLKGGIMHGHQMEHAFNLIRVNDLVWNYAVNNYLKGQKPKAFDVMYWTNDNTNLPAGMYLFYMKRMILDNKLSQKNALTICDTPIDIGKINSPVFVVGFKEDYISPPATVFTNTRLVSGPVEFILGESGHVMGVINPPSKNKYGHHIDGKLAKGYGEWQKTAHFIKGSWWLTWGEKIAKHSGNKIDAPKETGNKKYKILEPAPGSYVKEKCHVCFAGVVEKVNADTKMQH